MAVYLGGDEGGRFDEVTNRVRRWFPGLRPKPRGTRHGLLRGKSKLGGVVCVKRSHSRGPKVGLGSEGKFTVGKGSVVGGRPTFVGDLTETFGSDEVGTGRTE